MGEQTRRLVTDTYWPPFPTPLLFPSPSTLLPSRVHVRNACTRLLVYSRDISHYQGEPTAVVTERGLERERDRGRKKERATRAFLSFIFFSFSSGRCVVAHACVYGLLHTCAERPLRLAIEPGPTHTHTCTREFTLASARLPPS